jgi:MATE family multidrug resistance protein
MALDTPSAAGSDLRLRRRFFRLTAINILANLTIPLASLVDTGMLGHLADLRFLAGVALSSVLFDFIYWSFNFLRMGTTGLTAQAVGRGEPGEVYRTLYRSLALAAALAAAILVLQVVLREAGFALLAGAPGVEAAGREYFAGRIWGAPAVLANFALLGWFLGREESGRALAMSLTANVFNVALNYLFIIRLGLAARGAGLATMLSQYAMLIVAVALLLHTRRREGAVPWRWREVLDRGALAHLLRLNRDLLVRTFLLMSVFAVFLNLSATLGTVMLATNSILDRLLLFAAFAIDGAAFATESLAGIFRGRGDGVALRRLVRLSMATGVAFAAAFLAVLLSAQDAIYGLLTSHREVVDLARVYGLWLIPVLLIGAVAYVYDGLFLGLTAGPALRNSMLLSTLGVFAPLAAVAAVLGSNHLLWAAMVALMAARAATLGWASRRLLGGAG